MAGAGHTGVTLSIVQSIVRDTLPTTEARGGWGIQISGIVDADIRECLLERNIEVGILLNQISSHLDLEDTVIRGTKQNDFGEAGAGIDLNYGASLRSADCLFEDNASYAVGGSDPGTELVITNSEIRSTRQSTNGFGVGVGREAVCQISSTLMNDNSGAGLAVSGPGSRMEIEKSAIVETKPNENNKFGRGIQITDGASASLSCSLVSDNIDHGILVGNDDSNITVVGSIIRNTKSISTGEYGSGAALVEGARMEMNNSLVTENQTAGVMVFSPSTVLQLNLSTIQKTMGGGLGPQGQSPVYGDGVLAIWDSMVTATSTIIRDNSRTGLFYWSAQGTVSGCQVWRNSSYGVALQDCKEEVKVIDGATYQLGDLGNYFVGNCTDLAEEYVQQYSTTPGEMPVPDPPDIMDLSNILGPQAEDR